MQTNKVIDITDAIFKDASASVRELVAAIEIYCNIIETAEKNEPRALIPIIHRSLLDLYNVFIDLPDIELKSDTHFDHRITENEYIQIRKKLYGVIGKYDVYYQTFDPIYPDSFLKSSSPEGVSQGSMVDDLSDIYRDLKNTILVYRLGTPEAQEISLVELQISFLHWGNHLMDVLRPLHYLVYDHLGKK